jgi:hypothetical protein
MALVSQLLEICGLRLNWSAANRPERQARGGRTPRELARSGSWTLTPNRRPSSRRASTKEQEKHWHDLSPSTALYIPFDVCCTYVSTSHIRCTSCTSRVASGYGDGTPSMVDGSGAPVRVVRLVFRPGWAREGAKGRRQNPRLSWWIFSLDIVACLPRPYLCASPAMSLSNPRLCVPASIRASGINSPLAGTRRRIDFCCPRDR